MVKQVDRFCSMLNTPLQTQIQVDPRAACNAGRPRSGNRRKRGRKGLAARIGRSGYSAAIFAAAAAFSA